MDQRTQFIADYLRDSLSITELCELYRISRKSGYKWIDRYLRDGPAGLDERSRKPRRSPNQTPEHVVAVILQARQRHPAWGGKKLLSILQKRQPNWPCPARSTVCDILSRHGLVPSNGNADVSVIPVNPLPRSWPQTMCGRRISRAISKPATVSIAIP